MWGEELRGRGELLRGRWMGAGAAATGGGETLRGRGELLRGRGMGAGAGAEVRPAGGGLVLLRCRKASWSGENAVVAAAG